MTVLTDLDFKRLKWLNDGLEIRFYVYKLINRGAIDGLVKFHLLKRSFSNCTSKYVIERVYSPFAPYKKSSRRVVSLNAFLKETRLLSNCDYPFFDDIPF